MVNQLCDKAAQCAVRSGVVYAGLCDRGLLRCQCYFRKAKFKIVTSGRSDQFRGLRFRRFFPLLDDNFNHAVKKVQAHDNPVNAVI